jgi:hypothetical protein
MYITFLMGKSQGNIPLEGPRPTWEEHIIMEHQEL